MTGRFHVGDDISMTGNHNVGKMVGSPEPLVREPDSKALWGEPFVFVNYRKPDEKAASDIDAELTRQLGAGAVFRDARMPVGVEFPRELEHRASSCKVMISVIGRKWDDAGGLRLLSDPEDWVRREIAIALAHGAQVVPILVGVRDRLDPNDLPEDIRQIAFLQGPHLPRGYDAQYVRWLVEKLVRDLPALARADRFQR